MSARPQNGAASKPFAGCPGCDGFRRRASAAPGWSWLDFLVFASDGSGLAGLFAW